ncbi:MAG TPA: carbonic anhydrase [Candidatus Binatia bacterium]|jgi:carbonic anhydrase|nr:carbonic anhydrase [Candidatus Binatia bacterium]
MALGAVGTAAMGADGPPTVAPATPDAALAELQQGNQRFVKGEVVQPRRELERLRSLAEGQKPYAAVLGCADSRVPVELVFDEGFGDIFVVRVAGNLATAVEIASLEYGVAVLGVKVIMVVGHSGCGAVKAALDGGAVPGQISTLYQHIVPAIDRNNKDLAVAIQANARYQTRKLRESSTVIADAIKAGTLIVVGGVFDLTSGKVVPVDV